jgi:hypothetical protein
MYAGAKYGIQTRSKIIDSSGACCIVNTKNDSTEDSTSIILCGLHANVKKGLKINLGVGNSEYHGGSFVFYTSVFIQPPGALMMDVYSHFFNLSQNYNTMLTTVNQHTIDIATNTAAISNLVIPDLTDLEYKTQKQTYDLPSDTTTFASRLWCNVDIFVVSASYGTISLVGNRIKILTNESAITAIQGVNTAQATDISNNASAITAIQGVNTTQDTNISNNASAITAIQGVNTTQSADITAIQGVNTTQDTNISNNTSAITSLQTAQSSLYTSASGTCTSVTNETANNWNYLRFSSSNTVLITAPYNPTPYFGFRIIAAGVYKFRISFEHQKPTAGTSSNSNTALFMSFNLINGDKISGTNMYSIIPFGSCGNNVDNNVYAYAPNVVFSASVADSALVSYAILTDSTATPRPNLIGCEYMFRATANGDYKVQITSPDRNWAIKNVKWTMEYVTP